MYYKKIAWELKNIQILLIKNASLSFPHWVVKSKQNFITRTRPPFTYRPTRKNWKACNYTKKRAKRAPSWVREASQTTFLRKKRPKYGCIIRTYYVRQWWLSIRVCKARNQLYLWSKKGDFCLTVIFELVGIAAHLADPPTRGRDFLHGDILLICRDRRKMALFGKGVLLPAPVRQMDINDRSKSWS